MVAALLGQVFRASLLLVDYKLQRLQRLQTTFPEHDPAPTIGIPPTSATSSQMTSSVTSPVPQSPQPPMHSFVPQNPMMFQDPMGGARDFQGELYEGGHPDRQTADFSASFSSKNCPKMMKTHKKKSVTKTRQRRARFCAF